MTRIEELERKIAARKGQSGYAANVEALERALQELKKEQNSV